MTQTTSVTTDHTDVSAVLIVLNNREGVDRCLRTLTEASLARIIVVDGGSTDGTDEVLKTHRCDVYVIGKTGLAHARQYGIDRVSTPYVLLVDSDNIISQKAISTLKSDLTQSAFCGVAAQKLSYRRNNPYGLFQEWLNSKGVNVPGEKLVIGTPAMYYTSVLTDVRYDPRASAGDDTDLCYRLSLHGHRVGTGTARVYEEMPATFRSFIRKAYLYGTADSQFFELHPERRLSIGTHVFRNYLIRYFLMGIKQFKFAYLPYVVIYSTARMFGLYKTVVKNRIRRNCN